MSFISQFNAKYRVRLQMRKNYGYQRLIMLLLCGLSFLASPVFAANQVLDVSLSDQAPVSLTEYFAVLDDAGQALTLADLQTPLVASRFTSGQPPAEALNFSYTRSAIWLRLTLRNASATTQERLLQISKARLSSVQFFYPAEDGRYQAVVTGDLLPFATRPYPNRFFVFPVTLPAHSEQTLYLRVQSASAVFIPAKLWAPAAFHADERNDYLGQAWYFGMATAMVLFNLLLFIALRDVIYLLYVTFSTTMAFALAAQNGLIKEFSLFDSALFSEISAPAGFTLTLAAFLFFMRHMLQTWVVIPRMDAWLKVLIGLHLLSLLAFAYGKAHQVLYIISMVTIMSVGLFCAFKRQRSAYFFVVAFLLLFVAGVITSFAGLGLLPANALSMNALQFGSAMEMLLLAFALADRFIVMRREKERAQGLALAAQQQMVLNLQSSEKMLEERVAQRTAELQASNAALESSLQDLQATQSKLVQSEQMAWQGQRIANEALASQRQFIAMVSHEFRSPLAVIDAGVQLLAIKLQAAGDTAAILARIRRGVSRLSGFLDNCLIEDRLDSDGLSLHPAAIDLQALAASVSEEAQLISDRHHLVTEIAPALAPLDADPQLLRILLLNLLGNAIKYSPPGSEIRLRISQSGQTCTFEVLDQGLGIPADELPVIFQKYRRGRAAQGVSGAGLGLSLVMRIVTLHGGRVEIESREGEGTRVVVSLPQTLAPQP